MADDFHRELALRPAPKDLANLGVTLQILGSITILWGAVLYYFLSDGPSNATWLSAEQRTLAVARVAANGVGIKSKVFKRPQALEALLCPRAWLLTIAMFGSSVPNGILTNFSGTIIKDMGFSTYDAALLDCAGRSFQVISLLIAGFVATKFKNTRMLMVTVGNVICVIAAALLSFLPTEQSWGRLIAFWVSTSCVATPRNDSGSIAEAHCGAGGQ